MTEKGKKDDGQTRIDEKQRFRYIGFEVFPGQPKDLFKSDTEKKSLVEKVVERRNKHDIVREDCTLLEERVSTLDRMVMTIAAVIVLGSLFVPWYSAYNEIIEEKPATPAAVATLPADSMSAMTGMADSLTAVTGQAADTTAMAATGGKTALPADSSVQAAPGTNKNPENEAAAGGSTEGVQQRSSTEQVIHAYSGKKKNIRKEYDRVTGIGVFASFGALGSTVFSSGFVLILSAIIMLIYLLLCIALPIYTLYGIYGLKGNPDEKALGLKKIVRYNWFPVGLFVLVIFLSFIGANYGFDATAMYNSLGSSYGVDTLLGVMSWGIILTMCGFILMAVKGSEI